MWACSRWATTAALVFWAIVCPSLVRSAPSTSHGGVPYPLQDVKDPIESVEIVYPLDGAIEKAPLTFTTRINISPGELEHFTDQYSGMYLCIETSDLNRARNTTTRSCSLLDQLDAAIQHNESGNFTVSAYIAASAQVDKRYWQSNAVAFSVVSDAEFDAQIVHQVRQEGRKYPEFDLGILEWASRRQHQQDNKLVEQLTQGPDEFCDPATVANQNGENGEGLVLVVGIKTAVATNFAIRQAIRQTWASKDALPSGVKVFFIGCRPFAARGSSDDTIDTFGDGEADRRRLWGAIQLEKLVYGDLLTDELDCDDSYADLATKVKEFLHFTTTKYARAQYVMIADDDLYVRMDQIVHKLTVRALRVLFYSGQVRAIENAQKEKPVRINDGNYRYMLSNEQYPMNELPPFAIGAHFFLSMDCVEFISKNRRRLRDLAGMDDMSVALWMLAIQVHAQPFEKLEHLRGGPCTDNLVALGDLSPLSIRVVHDNILEGRRMCHGFNHHLWIKPSTLTPSSGYSRLQNFTETVEFEFSLSDPTVAYGLEFIGVISTDSLAGIKLSYFSSLETQLNYFLRMCGVVRLRFPGAARNQSCLEITRKARYELQVYHEQLNGADIVDLSRIELWRYNLFDADMYAPPFIVSYAPSAAFSRVVLECLFVSVFEDHKRPVLVVSEDILHQYYGGSPDVFIFSVLGGKCNPVSNSACQKMVAEYFERYVDRSRTKVAATTTDRSAQLVMLTGEAWSTEGLDERVLLISTVASANRTKHVHLSMASASFAERLDHGPLSLLSASESKQGTPKTKFCAYLYAHCGRSDRELMYDLLNTLRPVDALGRCAGSSRPPDSTKRASREAMFYNDDAVRRYAPYKFVIAFENTLAPGYVTEKLVNAFLAGSVPVYLGDSSTVSQVFNPASFIDCGRFASLQDCAEFVAEADDSPEIYARMLREPPVTNMTAFLEAFSWHPAVSSRFTADTIQQHFIN